MARNIEEIYEKAIEQTKPDLLETILEQKVEPMDEVDEIVKQEDITERKKGKKIVAFSSVVGVVAAVFILFVLYRPVWIDTTVTIDVNPAFEMQLDKKDIVKKAIGVNEEAKEILEQTQITGLDIEEATDKISVILVKEGYVKKNSVVLVSVEGTKEEQIQDMKERVKLRIEESCKSKQPVVLTQSMKKEENMEKVAKEYGISKGHAALICNMEKEDKEWTVEQLASMTVEELVTSAEKKGVLLDDISKNTKTEEKNVQNVAKENKIQSTSTATVEKKDTKIENKEENASAGKEETNTEINSAKNVSGKKDTAQKEQKKEKEQKKDNEQKVGQNKMEENKEKEDKEKTKTKEPEKEEKGKEQGGEETDKNKPEQEKNGQEKSERHPKDSDEKRDEHKKDNDEEDEEDKDDADKNREDSNRRRDPQHGGKS